MANWVSMLPNELLITHNLSPPIFFPLLCLPFTLHPFVCCTSGLHRVSSSQLCNKWRSRSEVSNYEFPVHPWDTLEHRKGATGNFHGYYRLEHSDEYIIFCCFPIILPQIRLCLVCKAEWERTARWNKLFQLTASRILPCTVQTSSTLFLSCKGIFICSYIH